MVLIFVLLVAAIQGVASPERAPDPVNAKIRQVNLPVKMGMSSDEVEKLLGERGLYETTGPYGASECGIYFNSRKRIWYNYGLVTKIEPLIVTVHQKPK